MAENEHKSFEPGDAWSEIQGDQVVSGLKEGKTVGQINEEFVKLTGLKKNPTEKRKMGRRRSFQVDAVDQLMDSRMGPRWGRNTRG